MSQESEWIDYNMIISEIRLHRSNAQRQIKEYREIEKERGLSPLFAMSFMVISLTRTISISFTLSNKKPLRPPCASGTINSLPRYHPASRLTRALGSQQIHGL